MTTVKTMEQKAVLVAWLAGHDLTAEGRAELRAAGMPVFASVVGNNFKVGAGDAHLCCLAYLKLVFLTDW